MIDADRSPQRADRFALNITASEALDLATHLFSSVGTDRYPVAVLDALRRFVTFDFFAVVYFPKQGVPVLLTDNLSAATSLKTIAEYTSGTYLLDPVYVACRDSSVSGLYRHADLVHHNLSQDVISYHQHLHPCVSNQVKSLADEIVYIVRLPDSSCLVLSLMRNTEHRQFDQAEVLHLSMLEPVVRETLVKHWPCDGLEVKSLSESRRTAGQLEKAFSEFAKDVLSSREQSVVSLLLRGHATLSIAHNLHIAEGTVKIHRKHIYEKLGINSQAQLFLKFCNYLLDEAAGATSVGRRAGLSR